MSFFVDANILIYAAVDCPQQEPCLGILGSIASGDALGVSSASVLEEVWHVERSGRIPDIDGLTSRVHTILTPLVPVTDKAFRFAMALGVDRLGTNDQLHLGTCIAHEIETMVSADRGFDGIEGLRRIDPLDSDAVELLLFGGL